MAEESQGSSTRPTMPSDEGESGSPEPQSSSKQVKKKMRRSRAGCRRCKLARKKCSEEHPRCKRCTARDWVCEYSSSTRRQSYSEVSAERANPSPSAEAQSAYLGGANLPNIASILNPVSFGAEPGQAYSDAVQDPWMSRNLSLDLADFTGSLDFIESAFPRINHVSPSSATSTDRPPVYDLHSGGGGGGLPSSVPLDAALGLSEHERLYLKAFEDEFWQVIVRKDQQPSQGHLHFSQLATFEPLKFAILAVGAGFRAQMEDVPAQRQALQDESIRFHSKAVRGLKVSIGNQPRSLWNAIIACTFCLFFYELIRGDITTTPAQHLLGALHLMKIDKNAGLNRTSTFHQKIFRYYDVIAALSLGRRPLTGSLTYQEKGSNLRTADGNYDQQHSTDPYGCVDNVFGLGASFWPLLHRLAELTRTHKELIDAAARPTSSAFAAGNSNSPSGPSLPTPVDKHQRISLAALELSIKEWQPQLELHAVNMEHYASDSALQSLLQNAESYRHAALIHLYRHHGEPCNSPRVQHAVQAALQCCLRVMVFGRPYGGLLWPLFTAGASALAANHRNIATTVCDQLLELQGLDNIAKAKSLLIEVWREMDVAENAVKWQDVAEKLGWSVVLA